MREHTKKTVDRLNELLKAETAAIRSYRAFLRANPNLYCHESLTRILGDHVASARMLADEVTACGGIPNAEADLWTEMRENLVQAADLMSPELAIKALKIGEERTARQVRNYIDSRSLPDGSVAKLASRLLPRQEQHVRELNRLQV